MALILQIRAETKAAQRQIEAAAKKTGASVKRLEKTSAASASKMSSAFGGVGKTLGTLGIGLGVGVAIAGIKKMITQTINFTDQIGKLSTRLGESTEFLSEMGFVAERSGVTFQAMSVGIQRANRRMAEARAGFGEAKKVLEELDLELNNADGSARNFEQILPDLADKINGLNSEQDKLRIAFKLFDTEGVSFLQFLKEGSEGIEQLRTEARSLGLSLDKDATDRAAKAKDALTDFQGATKGLTTEIVISLLPALSDWAEGMTTLITGFDQARIRANEWAKEQESNTSFLNRQIQALESQSLKLSSTGAAYGETAEETKEYKKILDLLVLTEGLELNNLESVNKLLAETIRLRRETKEEGEILTRKELLKIEGSIGEFRRAQIPIIEETERIYGGIVDEVKERVRLEERLIFLTNEQTLAQNKLFQITTSITTSLADAIIEGENLLKVLEQIAKRMASRALAGIFGGAISAALGLGFGTGFSLVSGFQRGGSFIVPGTGNQDRLVPVPLAPGERVDITPRNQVTNNRSINISITTRTIDDAFVRRELAPLMQRLTRDGNVSFGAA